MSILAWIVLGLVSGFIASKLVRGSGSGVVLDLVLGVIGAFVGGGAFNLIGQRGITGFDIWSVFVSVVGAIIVLAVYHLVRGRRSDR